MILKLSDSVDADLGKLLAMAIAFLETLAADFLEYEYLVGLGLIVEDGGFDDSTLHIRITELDLPFGVNQQDLVELYRGILGSRQAVDKNLFPGLDLELLACNVNNCVHKNKTFLSFSLRRARPRVRLPEPPGHKWTANLANSSNLTKYSRNYLMYKFKRVS